MQDCPPCAAVYVNPWALYTCGQVEVEALKHTFSVSFTGMPDVELSSPERWMAIERRRSASKPQPRHCFDRVLTSIQSVLQFVFGETAQEFGEESSQDEENDHSPDLGPKLVREYAWKKLKGGGSKSIRLLKLLDGDAVGEIRGELEEYRLSDPRRPRYYCISYAWGSALKLFPLRMADNSRMLLTASLYLGLRKLWATRKRHDSAEMVYVWADAICIDQIATDEKPKQILLLADIFRSAETVYAWLGDEEDESKSAIKKLEELASVVQAYSGLIKKNIDEFSVLAEEENLLPPKEDKIWGAVSKLLNRRWFSRIWIVQEVVLASKLVVICGDEEIAWETVHAGVLLCFWPELWGHAFSIADERTQKNVRELGNIRAWSRETGSFQKSDDLFTLICAFHQKDATQARDRLFALLSMATETPRSQLELGPADQELESRLSPDYVSSQHDVVKQYAQVFVEKGRALDMLCLARLAWDRDGLPSWVPDLTSQAFPKTISTWSRKFNASGAEISKPVKNSKVGNGVASCDGDALLIQGYKMDRIVKKANISSASNDLVAYIQDIFKFIDDTYGEKLKDSAPQLRMHRIESAKCKVPIGGAKVATTGSWGFDEQQGEVTRLDAYHALVVYLYDEHKGTWEAEARQIRAAAKGDSVLNEKARLWKRVWPYIETVKEFAEMFLPARAIACQTEGKRVGIVPDTAQEGDVVVVFRGAKVPVLLRETEDGSGHVVVGECYVHELMDGGAVSGAIEDGQSPQEFRLL